jgi:hypothetical protein
MTRLQRIENRGYKVTVSFSGTVYAEKGNTKLFSKSVTGLHKRIFGY